MPLVIFQNCLKFRNITRGIYAKYQVEIMLLPILILYSLQSGERG